MQTVLSGDSCYRSIKKLLDGREISRVMLVCGKHFADTDVMKYISSLGICLTVFTGFSPNPLYEQVVRGTQAFRQNGCEALISAGGGSAMDVAKCIKLFSKSDLSVCPIGEEYTDTGIFHIAIPTTAGTGSESTRHAVIYKDGAKQSISHPSLVPDVALLVPELIATLPVYQRKCTVMDALCQATESYWSVRSTEESRDYAAQAITVILDELYDFTSGASDPDTDRRVLEAANLAGAAINITATTAAHALSYKMTSLYGLPHGHAVALSMPYLWGLMDKEELIADKTARETLAARMSELRGLYGASSNADAAAKFSAMLDRLGLRAPHIEPSKIPEMVSAVNPERLSNHPVPLDAGMIEEIYRKISD